MNFTLLRRAVLLLGALVVTTMLLLGALGTGGSGADAATGVPVSGATAKPLASPRSAAATTPGGGLLGGVASIGSSQGSLQLGVLPVLGTGPLLNLDLPGLHVTVGKIGTSTRPGRPGGTQPGSGPGTRPTSAPRTGTRPSGAPSHARPSGGGAGTSRGVGAVGDGPRPSSASTPPGAQPSAPTSSAEALPPPPPSVYRALRQSFPYLAAVACAAAVLVFGFVLVVAVLARRRDPIPAGATPVRTERRRPRPRPGPAHWDYTFDASHLDQPPANPVGTRSGRHPFTRRP